MTAPLMPKGTAVWLVDNTTLTFKQIADFCELHLAEIEAIADGEVAYNILGVSPIANGQLTREEIARCEADETAQLTANPLERNVKERNAKAKKVLSPTQRAQKPNAILWIIKNCPEVIDSQICKLIGTTKPTIASIRGGTHADMANLRPVNPMAVGLCSEKDLEKAMLISKQQQEIKENKGKKKKVKKKTAKKPGRPKKKVTEKVAKKPGRPKKKVTEKVAKKPGRPKKEVTEKVAKKPGRPKKEVAEKVAKKPGRPKKEVTEKVAKKPGRPKKTEAEKAKAKKTTTKTKKETKAKKTTTKAKKSK